MIDAAARLHEAGLRVTRTRLKLLGLLDDPGGHRSADELVAAFRSRGTPVPRATVFHVLGALERAGLVIVADAGPGRTLYEAATRWHHHLVCRTCDAVVDVPCLRGEKPCLEPDLPGVRVDEAQVIFRGLCAACAAREDRAEPGDDLASALTRRAPPPGAAPSATPAPGWDDPGDRGAGPPRRAETSRPRRDPVAAAPPSR